MVTDHAHRSQVQEAKQNDGNNHEQIPFGEREKQAVRERKWDSGQSNSSARANLADIRRAPFHRSMRNTALGIKTHTRLADADVTDLHRRGWTSRISVYDIHESDRGKLPTPERARCVFDPTSQEYLVEEIEELRLRVLQSSVPSSERLIVVEDLTPQLVEVLGYDAGVEPALFEQHIGDSWGARGTAISPLVSKPGSSSPLEFTVPYPCLFHVSNPSIKNDTPWRTYDLELAARHLQCRQLLPALDCAEDNTIQCIAFEHITTSLNFGPGYDALVMFPPFLKHWEVGYFRVSKQQNIENRLDIPDTVMAKPGDSPNMDVATWEASLKFLGAFDNDLTDPFLVLESVWEEALKHWRAHLVYVAFCISFLSTPSEGQVEESRLQPEQQLRLIIHQGASIISGILSNMATADDVHAAHEKVKHGTAVAPNSSRFTQLKRDFAVVRDQLERHLPTLQHHTDAIRVNQQVRLAETQLEESRKAIQQADTIKRLTILAFVYIPIQTIASIYGMNVREFDPRPSIWTFALVAVILLAITM